MLAIAAPSGAAFSPQVKAPQATLQSIPFRVPDPATGGAAVSVQPVSSLQPMTPTASSVPTPVTTSIGDSADGDGEAERAAELEQRAAAAEADMQRLLQQEIQALAQRDREVRAHEQAHLAVGGQYAGPVSYDYQRGPDGRLYAVGGSVAIDVAPIPDDPEATLQKMQQVQRAALAPAEPSAQDLAVAAQASQQAAAARAELAQDNLAEEEDEVASSSSPLRNLIDSVEDERSVEIAVTAQAPDSDVDPSLRNRAAMASYQSTEQNANLSALLDLRA